MVRQGRIPGGKVRSQDPWGHKNGAVWGLLSVAEIEASEWGSWLKTASLGTSFLLRVAINCEPMHGRGTALRAGPWQKAEAQ